MLFVKLKLKGGVCLMSIDDMLREAIDNIDVQESKIGDIVMLTEVCSGCM